MKIITYFTIIISLLSCNNTTTHSSKKLTNINKKKKSIGVDITYNKKNTITIGDIVTFKYSIKKNYIPDSIKLSVDFKKYKIFQSDSSIIWDSKQCMPGERDILLTFYFGDSISTSKNVVFTLLSDIVPEEYSFKVKNRWKHNINSYTQGLEFNDNYLYEGTGNYGKSMLYKFNFNDGTIIQSLNIDNNVFGEGITIINNKLYQLTWQSNTGYVYNKQNFTKLFEFNYPTEGWGLTNNGKELIMSDGSNNIYFLDTTFIQETHKIEVYNNIGAITRLNELELIDSLIYANVYGSNIIVAFDINTGKVVKQINLTGILNKQDIKNNIDVLNGIAWDKKNKRLIVTGKWWPFLYEIELVKR
jgi:glutamine cyclotransferase